MKKFIQYLWSKQGKNEKIDEKLKQTWKIYFANSEQKNVWWTFLAIMKSKIIF
jgi:hypothetical protein